MSTLAEKGGGSFQGLKLLLFENPLPPLDEAIEAATMEIAHSNPYTEPCSAPLRQRRHHESHRESRVVHRVATCYSPREVERLVIVAARNDTPLR